MILAVAYFAYDNLKEKVEPIENQESEAEERVQVPEFTVLDSEGNSVLMSSFVGKPVVLNFWASWCGPCKSEMPDFNKVYQELGEDVEFVMINSTDGERETIESAKKYVEEQGFSFSVYFDTKFEASRACGISALPSTLFVDAEGYAVAGIKGTISEKVLRSGIAGILPKEAE